MKNNDPAIQLRLCLPLLFWLSVGLVSVLALIPSTAVPQAFHFWDKAQHGLAYAGLAMSGYLAFPLKLKRVFIGLIAHGALIEIMQSALTTTRFGDPLDWLADAIGVVFGLMVYAALRFARQRR